jgi:hypothetical protein
MTRRNTNIIIRNYLHKSILVILLLFTSFSIISGQKGRQQKPPLKERLFFGGSFGLQFGTITNIDVSPVIGLWVLPKVNVAVGPEYTYYKDPNFSTSIYGGKIYSQLVLIQDFNSIIPLGVHLGLFLHAEYESLSLESAVWNPSMHSERFMTNTVLGGGGISQMLGERASLNLIVLWVLDSSNYEFYSNPEIRISFNF